MAIAVTPGEITKVYLPCDEDLVDHEKTWFHIAAVDYKLQQRLLKYSTDLDRAERKRKKALKDEVDGETEIEITIDEGFIKETLGEPGRPVALVGWENFYNAKGDEIKFDKKTFLNNFNLTDLFFLASKVYSIQFLSEADEKN